VKPLSLNEQHRAISAIANAERLLALDSVWTGYLADVTTVPPQDVATLTKITKDMHGLLSSCPADAQWTQALMQRDPEGAERAFETALAKLPIDSEMRTRIGDRLLARRGLLGLIDRAARDLPQRAQIEQRDIADKIARIARGHQSDGDLSQDASCMLQGYVLGLTAGMAVVTVSATEGIFAAYQAVELAQHCF
jgi:hypothetical protein